MKILMASDHAGFKLKEKLKEYLESKDNIDVEDLGVYTDQVSANYAEQGLKLGNAVMENKDSLGIVVCGSGIGISIAANKVKGIIAARITSIEDAELAKKHNGANVIAFGGRQISPELAIKMLDSFLANEFEGGRHLDRINLLK